MRVLYILDSGFLELVVEMLTVIKSGERRDIFLLLILFEAFRYVGRIRKLYTIDS